LGNISRPSPGVVQALRAPAVGVLAGGFALALGLAGLLLFFSAKDDPYGLGWLLTALWLGGAVTCAALNATVIAAIVRGRSDLPPSRAVIGTLACVLAPLLGWTGALLLDGGDSTPGSTFMIWAIASSIVGFAAPLPVTAWMRHVARTVDREAPRGAASPSRPTPGRWLLITAAGLPGATTACLFGLLGDPSDEGLFSMMLGIAAAVSMPVLTAMVLAFRGRRRRLVVGLVLWFVGTAMLLGAMIGGWVVYELITGLMRFRL